MLPFPVPQSVGRWLDAKGVYEAALGGMDLTNRKGCQASATMRKHLFSSSSSSVLFTNHANTRL